jgi:hypothetical protein
MKRIIISVSVCFAFHAHSQNATVLPAKKSTVPQDTDLKLETQTAQKNAQALNTNADAVPLPATRMDRPDTTLQLIMVNSDDQKIFTEPKKSETKSSPK